MLVACHTEMLRCTLLLLLLEALRVCWTLEQPAGSNDIFPLHPRLNWFKNEVIYAP